MAIVLIQSTITGTPLRSHLSMIRKFAWSTSSACNPNFLAPATKLVPVVPLRGLVRQAFAITFSDARIPKCAITIFKLAGPHIARRCLKLAVLSGTPAGAGMLTFNGGLALRPNISEAHQGTPFQTVCTPAVKAETDAAFIVKFRSSLSLLHLSCPS